MTRTGWSPWPRAFCFFSPSNTSTINVQVDKHRFLLLLQNTLRYRWLSDRKVVHDATVRLFGRRSALHRDFVSQIVAAHRSGKLSDARALWQWLRRNQSVNLLFRKRSKFPVAATLLEPECSDETYRWPVPRIETANQLADFLCLATPTALDWLTLPHRRHNTSVDHYSRVAHRKRDGSIRWIEQPAPTLKHVQRLIANELLPLIPLHDAAYGFRRRRNVRQCAEQHVGRKLVLRMDLCDFFHSIHFGRVCALFKIAGYSSKIAALLGQLCTAPANQNSEGTLLHSRLPQGAPSSPGLANAIAFRLDRRIAGLCESVGVTYTRYADDLIFSSDEMQLCHAKRFATTVAVIAMEEGFQVNFRKTRIARHGNRQRVLGLTVNNQLNTSRKEYETLKAILHNCIRHGPESQNRQQHPHFRESLLGRIAYIASVNPDRAEKLMRSYELICW